MTRKLQVYFRGVLWFILSTLSSSMNDVLSKYIGSHLGSYEITFFRFLFGTLTLIPFIIYYGTDTIKTRRSLIHFARGGFLFIGIAAWTYGLSIAPVTTATVVSFTIPIFVLILGVFFLNENIIWQRWFVTLFVFLGLLITLDTQSSNFNPKALIFVFAAICFAILDIINKKFVEKETTISMLFYSAIITAMLSLPFALMNWITPTAEDLILLFILGTSANLILFFLLKAFALVDATALAPYRYFELIISAFVAYLVFKETPTSSTIIGSLLIIPSTFFIIYSENKYLKKNNK
ncbi:MAG TPA: DMT family transporter [Candidatus Megaira endosymbiont of Nemacystus decipiens]|nr:DMT family transporter [Candidatus Megaera endosymbiont of Nemacystus decipiens]